MLREKLINLKSEVIMLLGMAAQQEFQQLQMYQN